MVGCDAGGGDASGAEQVSGWQRRFGYGWLAARAREGFCAEQDGETWLFLHGAAAAVHFLGHIAARHVVVLA
jgi:hypothetical protein